MNLNVKNDEVDDKVAFLLGSSLRNLDTVQFIQIYETLLPKTLTELQVTRLKERARAIAELPQDEFNELVLRAKEFSLVDRSSEMSQEEPTKSEEIPFIDADGNSGDDEVLTNTNMCTADVSSWTPGGILASNRKSFEQPKLKDTVSTDLLQHPQDDDDDDDDNSDSRVDIHCYMPLHNEPSSPMTSTFLCDGPYDEAIEIDSDASSHESPRFPSNSVNFASATRYRSNGHSNHDSDDDEANAIELNQVSYYGSINRRMTERERREENEHKVLYQASKHPKDALSNVINTTKDSSDDDEDDLYPPPKKPQVDVDQPISFNLARRSYVTTASQASKGTTIEKSVKSIDRKDSCGDESLPLLNSSKPKPENKIDALAAILATKPKFEGLNDENGNPIEELISKEHERMKSGKSYDYDLRGTHDLTVSQLSAISNSFLSGHAYNSSDTNGSCKTEGTKRILRHRKKKEKVKDKEKKLAVDVKSMSGYMGDRDLNDILKELGESNSADNNKNKKLKKRFNTTSKYSDSATYKCDDYIEEPIKPIKVKKEKFVYQPLEEVKIVKLEDIANVDCNDSDVFYDAQSYSSDSVHENTQCLSSKDKKLAGKSAQKSDNNKTAKLTVKNMNSSNKDGNCVNKDTTVTTQDINMTNKDKNKTVSSNNANVANTDKTATSKYDISMNKDKTTSVICKDTKLNDKMSKVENVGIKAVAVTKKNAIVSTKNGNISNKDDMSIKDSRAKSHKVVKKSESFDGKLLERNKSDHGKETQLNLTSVKANDLNKKLNGPKLKATLSLESDKLPNNIHTIASNNKVKQSGKIVDDKANVNTANKATLCKKNSTKNIVNENETNDNSKETENNDKKLTNSDKENMANNKDSKKADKSENESKKNHANMEKDNVTTNLEDARIIIDPKPDGSDIDTGGNKICDKIDKQKLKNNKISKDTSSKVNNDTYSKLSQSGKVDCGKTTTIEDIKSKDISSLIPKDNVKAISSENAQKSKDNSRESGKAVTKETAQKSKDYSTISKDSCEISVAIENYVKELNANDKFIFTDIDSLGKVDSDSEFCTVVNRRKKRTSQPTVAPLTYERRPRYNNYKYVRSVTPPPRTRVNRYTKPSSDINPNFPVLNSGPLPTSGRRNSIGDVPVVDDFQGYPDDSDLESVKSLPVTQSRMDVIRSPSSVMSYARMAASPRVSSTKTSSRSTADSIPAVPKPAAIEQPTRPAVWKGVAGERRHSIGSHPDTTETEKETVTVSSLLKSGSQDLYAVSDQRALIVAQKLEEKLNQTPNDTPKSTTDKISLDITTDNNCIGHDQVVHRKAAISPGRDVSLSCVCELTKDNMDTSTVPVTLRGSNKMTKSASSIQDRSHTRPKSAIYSTNGRKNNYSVIFLDKRSSEPPPDITFGFDFDIMDKMDMDTLDDIGLHSDNDETIVKNPNDISFTDVFDIKTDKLECSPVNVIDVHKIPPLNGLVHGNKATLTDTKSNANSVKSTNNAQTTHIFVDNKIDNNNVDSPTDELTLSQSVDENNQNLEFTSMSKRTISFNAENDFDCDSQGIEDNVVSGETCKTTYTGACSISDTHSYIDICYGQLVQTEKSVPSRIRFRIEEPESDTYNWNWSEVVRYMKKEWDRTLNGLKNDSTVIVYSPENVS